MVQDSTDRRTILSLVTGSATAALAGCFGGGDGNGNGNGSGNGNGNGDGNGTGNGNGNGDDEYGEIPEADETVLVGAGGEERFDPETLEIEPGTSVVFVWEGDAHNVLLTDQPDDSDWEGVRNRYNEGYSHKHTFEVEGRYAFECGRHSMLGETGEIIVGDVDSDGTDGGDDGGNETDGGDGNETDSGGNETDGGGNETDDGGNETDGGDGNETDSGGNETDAGE